MTAIEIKSAAPVVEVYNQDRTLKYGAQWELKIKLPWTNLYEGRELLDTTWLEQSQFSEQPALGHYEAMLEKTNMKKKRDGTYDGSKEWMWNWRILELTPSSAQAPQQASSNGAPAQDRRPVRTDGQEVFRTKEELRWTEAMHMATRMVAGRPSLQDEQDEAIESTLEIWATWFYEQLSQPPGTPQQPQELDSGASEPKHWEEVPNEPITQGAKFCPTHQTSELGPDGTHYFTDNGQRVLCRRGGS